MLSPALFSFICLLFLFLPVAIIYSVQRELTGVVSPEFGLHSLSVFSVYIPRNLPEPSVVKIQQPPIPKDDEPLFRLASRVNPNLPHNSTRKLAFMYLTSSPLPFAPLWELFFNGVSKDLYNIYIHADPTRDYNPGFSGVFLNRVIHSSKPSARHTPTLAAAARRLLAHALLDDQLNYMFAMISPSCIPIHSFDFIYKTLISSRKSFIEILKDEPWQYVRWAARGETAMLPEVKLEECRIGSQFWVLKRKHARMVARDRRIWSKFNQTCVKEWDCYPEENYFSTLINMLDPRGCIPATLTHVDWSVNVDGHPRMYEAVEVVPELIVRLRMMRPRYGDDGINGSDWSKLEKNDPFLFARKFSKDAIEPLVGMARTVLFNDSVLSV